MILYHGSNVEVRVPQIRVSERLLDFGTAFYLTSNLEQAIRWAKLTTERKKGGRPVVSVYEIDDSRLEALTIRKFEAPSAKWLRYVVMHRRGTAKKDTSDVVIGPVANDQTSSTIFLFLGGELSVAETIRRLLPQRLKDQYAFRTEKAIALLKYRETIEI